MLRIPHHPEIEALLAPCYRAYSDSTIKGYGADLRCFIDWCKSRGCGWLPAAPDDVAAFVDHALRELSIATIKRRLCAIAFAHRLCGLTAPMDAAVVKLAVRRASRLRSTRPRQVRGLTNDIREQVIARCPDTLVGLRDAAIISVGYDALCRSSELAAMRVEHLHFNPNDNVYLLVPRSKADPMGKGRVAYLSPASAKILSTWIRKSGFFAGPLFRSYHLQRFGEEPLDTSSIRRLIKRAAERAGIDPSVAAKLSGHSMRVGAAQDMLNAGFDALAIMQAGGWKSANVVLRYVENASTRQLHERRWGRLGQLRS